MKCKDFLALLLAFTTVSLHAQTVKTHTEKGVDIRIYETFTVMKGEFMTPPDMRKVNEEALYQAIKKAVVKEMQERGYNFIEDSTAQLRVSYVAGSYNMTDAGVNGPLGQTPAATPSDINQSRSWSTETREGMLVLDIMDSSNKKQIWKAETSNLTLEGGDFDHAMEAVIFKAFKKFPDKNKKKRK
jgi:hypothetical protein